MLPMITALVTKFFSERRPRTGLRSTQAGFTFIEMLAVTVLIGVMVSIATVGYFGASRSTRDSRRKQDLSQLRFALETYKQTYGEYPDTGTGCGTWAYPGCQSSGDWIPGLVPEYIVALPNDPKQNGGSDLSQEDQFSYRYQKVSDSAYYLVTKLENTDDNELNGTDYGLASYLYVVTEAK